MGPVTRRGFLSASAGGAAAAALSTVFAEPVPAAVPAGRRARAALGTLGVAGDRFVLGGEPFQIISGAIHYFRIHPDQWQDRLLRLRALGLNTVETYVAWNFHQPTPGKPDFTGWRDLPRFIRLAGETGFHVIVRPSPYICAEWEFGGLPAWLLADRDMELRCADPAYLRAVDAWYDELMPRLRPLEAHSGGPIIALQIENEYGSYGNDTGYLAHLRDAMRARGIRGLLFAADGANPLYQRFGALPGTLETGTGEGDPAANMAALRQFQPGKPVMMTEYWDGWFDHWTEQHHTTDPVTTAADVGTLLAAGASLNLYMACGGTNFGFTSGANTSGTIYQPTVTSYDYDAPVGEAGDVGAKFAAIRATLARYTHPTAPIPRRSPRLAPQTLTSNGKAALLGALPRLSRPVHSPRPLPMEKLGQATGLIHYRTTVQGPHQGGPLHIEGLADRALVFQDGRYLGLIDRNLDNTVHITLPDASTRLDILVDTGGRVNYGPYLADRKGIDGWVALNTQQKLFGWTIFPLPLDDLTPLRFGPAVTAAGPAFHRFPATVTTPADGYVALPGWTKGIVWLNGFNLGRYWNTGPQRALYAPAPLWRRGHNELVVLELHQPGGTVEIRPEAELS